MKPDKCERTFTGEHVWGRRKAQLKAPVGGEGHPTVKESWVEFIGCPCGARMPQALMPEFLEGERETRRIKSLRFGGEAGEQGELL